MPHTEFGQFAEKFRHAIVREILHPLPAIGHDDSLLTEIPIEQSGYEVAFLSLQELQDLHLIS